jgi:hypothetical protein
MSRNFWIGVFSIGALAGVIGGEQRSTREEMRRVTVDLAKLDLMSTAVGYRYTNRPPWPEGNCVTLKSKTNGVSGLPAGHWGLVNMHAENYGQLVKRRGFKSLELGLLADQRCIVVDARVPQEWFLSRPCTKCYSLERRQSLKVQFGEYFRKERQAEALLGTAWVLVNRKDPDGLLARVLPGDGIEFGAVELICRDAGWNTLGRRSWECGERKGSAWMSIYDVRSATNYTGASFTLSRQKERMTLVPHQALNRTADSFGGERYTGSAEAVYRLKKNGGN